MADSTTNIPQMSSSQASKEVTFNAAMDAASPAMLYGRNMLTTTGLTWGFLGGRFNGASIANGTVALTASTTNYVVAAHSNGAVSVSTAATNWDDRAAYVRLCKVVTGTATISSYEDHRGADPAGTASTAVSDHVGAADPHTQYALETDVNTALAGKQAAITPNSVTASELTLYTTTSLTPVKMGTLTCTITTSGKPVLVLFKAVVQKSDAIANAAICVRRGGANIGYDFIIPGPDNAFYTCMGAFMDSPSAGTHNYEFYWNVENTESLSTVSGADPRFTFSITAKEQFV